MISKVEKYNGQVVELTFGPAPANILSAAVIEELAAALMAAEQNPHTKLVVLSGEGKHFSFGASVEEHAPALVKNMLPTFHKLIGQILELSVPTMAKVKGMCLGGGFEVAMACTYIFAEETAQLGVPEIQLGVFPPVAALLLPKLVGNKACEMVLSGAKFGAADLKAWGLVHATHPKEALDAEVAKFVETHLIPRSASSLRLAHKATRFGLASDYKRDIPCLEKLYLETLMSTKDAVEGIESFLQKRAPQWVDA